MFCWICICMLFIVNSINSHDFYGDNLIIGNLIKREVIPLAQINNPYGVNGRRKFNANSEPELNYRRSRDIRAGKGFENAQNEQKEENKDSELRWLTIDTDEGIGIGL